MSWSEEPIELTPERFELEVKGIFEMLGADMASFSASHREKIAGVDGVYEIDVSVRFEALGANFLVLVECKHQRSPVKRDVVQILYDRLRSIGAHKGMIFASTTFQRGALEYAKQHGIALIRLADGETCWETRAIGPSPPPPSWANIPPYVGWWTRLTEDGNQEHTLVSVRDTTESLLEFLRSGVSA